MAPAGARFGGRHCKRPGRGTGQGAALAASRHAPARSARLGADACNYVNTTLAAVLGKCCAIADCSSCSVKSPGSIEHSCTFSPDAVARHALPRGGGSPRRRARAWGVGNAARGSFGHILAVRHFGVQTPGGPNLRFLESETRPGPPPNLRRPQTQRL